MQKNTLKIIILLSSTAISSMASAGSIETMAPEVTAITAPAAGNIGFIGINAGYSYLNDAFFNAATGITSGQIEGMYGFSLGNNLAVIEGMARFASYSDTQLFWGAVPDFSAQIGGHYIVPLANGMNIGGFAGYGYAPHDSNNPTELYQVVFGGVELTKPIGQNIVAFGQVGYGTTLQNSATHNPAGPLASAGFYNGYFLRAGASYTGLGNTILTLDLELAGTQEYEDATEPGEMWSAAFRGETPVAMDGRLVATYEARYGWFNALGGDNDSAEEMGVKIGVRYMFGGSTSKDLLDAGMIGLPYIPLRASTLTPVQD